MHATQRQPEAPSLLQEFEAFYSNVDTAKLGRLREIYAPDVSFTDPVHSLQNLKQLEQYFQRAFKDLKYCRFEFTHLITSGDQANYEWIMHYAHPRIRSGQNITVRGASVLTFTDKVTRHQDYYDMGEMLYEQVPLLGKIIRAIKGRVG